jgi:hypothetical protein
MTRRPDLVLAEDQIRRTGLATERGKRVPAEATSTGGAQSESIEWALAAALLDGVTEDEADSVWASQHPGGEAAKPGAGGQQP